MPALKNPKPHVHIHSFLKDGRETISEDKRVDKANDPLTVTNLIKQGMAFLEFNESYAFYRNEAVEYVRLEGTLVDQGYKLTVDAFTCYCEPLNENQDPPF